MNEYPHDPLEYFELRPVRAAIVSEISEATAASPLPPEERVNFHIGNPVQDERLVASLFQAASGMPVPEGMSVAEALPLLLADPGWEEREKPRIEFLHALIRKSAPYMPRGGYQRSTPGTLITLFSEWLSRGQPEPLSYDLGEKSGRREVILASGGTTEVLRVFLHALSVSLRHLPGTVYLLGARLPAHLTAFPQFRFPPMPEEEHAFVDALRTALQQHEPRPSFLVLGRRLQEETRRTLRHLALLHPLCIIEINDAPNHQSLAREAGMMKRVIRFLTPAVFSPRLGTLSTVFVAGSHEFVTIIEVAHFQLKGTPSASEIELLTFLLEHRSGGPSHEGSAAVVPGSVDAHAESLSPTPRWRNPLAPHAEMIGQSLARLLSGRAQSAGHLLETITLRHAETMARMASRAGFKQFGVDPFAGIGYGELCGELCRHADDPVWQLELSGAFLSAFLRHHPEYRHTQTAVVSGSSRTALGLLGFHCGVQEVVIPDLSWTYEHCFPRVTTVPLTAGLALDVERMIQTVQEKMSSDPAWTQTGAVALNNPHNATGQRFRDSDVRRLLLWLLEHRVVVIDDLAYENVVPGPALEGPKTLRQTAEELVRAGYLTSDHADHLVTVHSISKTDCLAGARLAVVELRHAALFERFTRVNDTLTPNIGAIFLSYLFYRNGIDTVNQYWTLRNAIFDERMRALEEAVGNLPEERNRYAISIRRPTGSMYPLMMIDQLPAGLSLDWLSSGLARQGIGLLPLSTFARTEEGYDTGRKTFRLTLGGTDTADRLLSKTRRVLIDLNRMIAEQERRYNRETLLLRPRRAGRSHLPFDLQPRWRAQEENIKRAAEALLRRHPLLDTTAQDRTLFAKQFLTIHLPDRLRLFARRFEEQCEAVEDLLATAAATNGTEIIAILERELTKDNLAARQERFRQRSFDRTVHPTQMYSIKAELLWEEAIESALAQRSLDSTFPERLAAALLEEYLGRSVAIVSADEGDELLLDLKSFIAAEDFATLRTDTTSDTFLSYWGDWDGSNRPSGQGHRLVAAVLLENVTRLAALLRGLLDIDPTASIDPELRHELHRLPSKNAQFKDLLDEITLLTHQLEWRYRGILPFHVKPGAFRRVGMTLHLARDPLTSLWQHNDRLERRMLALRLERKEGLRYAFALNKRLRKTLHGLLPAIQANLRHPAFARDVVRYRDMLKRFVITPRIHQKLITAQDPFAIDTTVHNIAEINDIAGTFGNPGMILALQISMSTMPEALIALDRKMRASHEEVLRTHPGADLPRVWLIPLCEDATSVRALPGYLNKVWEYAIQSRRLNQVPGDRFREIMAEVFIAGSDLSQHVGQTPGMAHFVQAKYAIISWLAERGLVGGVRVKMGSGEPMQRQGGYYAPQSGQPAFLVSPANQKRLATHLQASAKKSTEYATTPLMGILAGGDLRTFQSNLSEALRFLPVHERAQLLYHVHQTQRFYTRELTRAAEPLVETRLQFVSRGLQELQRLTAGGHDPVFDDFIGLVTEAFRHIVYGTAEDVVGIHIISYFIARTTPPLRDRPTVRPGRGVGEGQGHQILQRIAETIPLSKYGSLLRAIAHNQAQTMVLGINQLTTGLFRALDAFAQREYVEGSGAQLTADRIMPRLPVYEMLHTLRLYHDTELTYLGKMERAFPAGNSAVAALREDLDAMKGYLGLFQRELLRRHGVNVANFFEGNRFILDLLPTVRPDLAVLLQPDLFNADAEKLFATIRGTVDSAWKAEVELLLGVPREVRAWRARAWELLERPVVARVASFVELAVALSSLAGDPSVQQLGTPLRQPKRVRPEVRSFLRSSADDSMHEFLSAALEYLSGISQEQIEVPTTVVKALKEVERILTIEEQALAPRDQDRLRFYLLQIARLCRENG